MNLRNLARFLANEDIVQRLANSSIIRRLAQLAHYSYIKASQSGGRAIDKFAEKQHKGANDHQLSTNFVFSRFLKRFYENMKSEIEKNNRK